MRRNKDIKTKEVKNQGITLIALVITIIVLLILAGISIAMLTGENGILNKANTAKIQTEIASIKEEIQTEILAEQAGNNGNISDDTLKGILEKYGVLSPEEEKLIDKTLTTTKGNYEIKVSDLFNGATIEDGSKGPTFTKVANAPDTAGFNKSSTYYVSWDLTSSPYAIDDATSISGIAPSNWYDYTEGVNHWANVKTTGGGNDCYWVWIPRYAYCITEGYHTNTAGTIDIKFLKGTTNTPIDGSNITISNSLGAGNWNVHPAFWFDQNNNGIEDEGEQLTGIWVAKYEASSSSVDTINLENGILTGDTNSLNGLGGGTDTNLTVRVKPNVTSWRSLNVNGIYTVCKNLTTSGNSLEGTTVLDSHMMKNIDWGAVAYLSSSKYGKVDSSGSRVRVYSNPYYNDTVNYSPITGLAGATTTQQNNGTTTNLYRYNTQEGIEASTTGNVYGIYDMVGGTWEYVAGIDKKIGESNEDRSKLWDPNNAKYVDQYTEYEKYGDAMYETSICSGSFTGAWDSSFDVDIFSENPLIVRCGRPENSNSLSLFSRYHNSGRVGVNNTFRPVVLSSKP